MKSNLGLKIALGRIMAFKVVFIFLMTILIFSSSKAEENLSSRENEVKRIYPGISIVWKYLSHLPIGSGNQKGLKVWMDLVGLSEYQSELQLDNDLPGIKKYFKEKLEKEPSFKNDLFKLNQWLLEENTKILTDNSETFLLDEAGKGEYSNFQPGFLWSELIKISNNSPRRSFQILAATIHDPRAELDLSLPFDAFLTEREKQMLSDLNFSLKKMTPQSKEFIEIRNKINKIYDGMNLKMGERNLNSKVNFSKNTLLNLPKSLGPDVDISEELKNKIKKYINEGALYSKFYHVHLAAFMSCEMISSGMDPKLSMFMQKWTAWGYRTVKLNLHLKRLFKKIKSKHALSESEQSDLLAAKLMQTWFTGGNIEDEIFIPFSNLSLSDLIFKGKSKQVPDADELSNLWLFLKGFAKPLFMTEREFYLAKRKLKLWITEWEWTIAQHELGSQIAFSTCKINN